MFRASNNGGSPRGNRIPSICHSLERARTAGIGDLHAIGDHLGTGYLNKRNSTSRKSDACGTHVLFIVENLSVVNRPGGLCPRPYRRPARGDPNGLSKEEDLARNLEKSRQPFVTNVPRLPTAFSLILDGVKECIQRPRHANTNQGSAFRECHVNCQ